MALRGENIGQAYVKVLADGSEIPDGIEEGLADADDEVSEAGERHGREYGDNFGKGFEDSDVHRRRRRVLGEFEGSIRRINHYLDVTADRMGAITGRGSRNNFLNFVGSLVRNFSRLLFLIPKISLEIGGRMAAAFSEAGGGGTGLLKAFQSLLPLVGTLAVGLAAVGVAVGVLAIVLGPLVAAFSLLLGILTALAGTVAFALVGALAAILGPLVAVGVGAGVLAASIASMSDNMKKALKEDVEPLIDGFRELGRVGAESLVKDLGQNARDLVPVLENLRPLVRRVADAFSDMATQWVEDLNSPSFERFIDRIDRFIPRALRRMGEVAANTLGGIGGLFTGMIPFLNDFLNWLVDITQEFSDWANSKRGQREIKAFFEDVSDSAKALAGFLGEVWGFLTFILDAGRGTGDSIFDRMAANIERFQNFLEENPDAVSDWFRDAEDFAIALGDLIIDLGELIDRLDNPATRELAEDIIMVVGHIADLIAGIGTIYSLLQGRPPEGLMKFFESIANSIEDIFSRNYKWTRVLPDMDDLVNPFKGLGRRILGIIGDIRLARLMVMPSIDGILDHFSGLGSDILVRIGKIHLLKNFVYPVVSAITVHFVGWGADILDRMGDVRLFQAFDFPTLSEIASHFSGLGQAILNAIGRIDIGSLIDIPDPGGGVPYVPGVASGGLFTRGAALRWIGEDGPEAVVPLDRDLSRVDPAVRALSAYAQGLSIPGMAAGGTVGRTVDVGGVTIITPTEDPHAVALETINEIVARVS